MASPRKRPQTHSSTSNVPKTELASADTVTLHSNLPLIEVTEPWLLDTLMKDTQANRLILMRLDERTALVVPGQHENLLTRLRKLGHTPRTLER